MPRLPTGPKSFSRDGDRPTLRELLDCANAAPDYALYISGKTCLAYTLLSEEHYLIHEGYVRRPTRWLKTKNLSKPALEDETNLVNLGHLSIEWQKRLLNVKPKQLLKEGVKCDFHLRRSTANPYDIVFCCDSHQVSCIWNCDAHYQLWKANQ